MRVLVLDDEISILEMITDMLEPEGFDVITAPDGNKGMQIVECTPDIDIVITDMMMPEKEGLETVIELKTHYPSIKILAISGGGINQPEAYLDIARKMGADATLCKPFIKKQLLDCLQEIV